MQVTPFNSAQVSQGTPKFKFAYRQLSSTPKYLASS
jgi:hypothetical protein